MSAHPSSVTHGSRQEGRLTLDDSLVARAVLETNDIPNLGAELDLHLLADALGDTHGGDTTRLGTADDPILTVPLLMEELRELSRLARSCLSNTDDDCEQTRQYCSREERGWDSPWFSRMTLRSASRDAKAGRYWRCSLSVLLREKALAPVEALRCEANCESVFLWCRSSSSPSLASFPRPLPLRSGVGAMAYGRQWRDGKVRVGDSRSGSGAASTTPVRFPRVVPAI